MKLPKILLLLAIGYWLLAIIASPVLAAAEVSTGGSLGNFQKTILDNRDAGTTSRETFVGDPESSVLSDTANGLTTMIVGEIKPLELVPQENSYRPGGAIGSLNTLISYMYTNPPASSVEYFADLGRNLGIVKPVYAQTGIGFEGLKPILPLWKAFRNIAYLFFTIIFVVMGFAIMFRMKLDPQTVISIQNAIPRVVVALILVTFSYAIAGLLIDLIYVFIGLGVLVIAPIGGLDITANQKQYMGLGFGEGVGILIGGGSKAIWQVFGSLMSSGPSGILGGIVDILTVVFAGLGGVLATLILAIIAFYVIFKLFISLLQCYIGIIISIVFAPLQIMLGVLPGSKMGFGAWFKGLLANILVFPAVAIFMLLGWILASSYARSGPAWTPPVISVGGEALPAIIALGMLLLVHKIPDMVKKIMGVEGLGLGGALGETFAPAQLAAQARADHVKQQAAYRDQVLHEAPSPKERAEEALWSVLKTKRKIE